MKDLYNFLLDIYLNYNIKQIYDDRINIRKILDKILQNNLSQYFFKIEEFLNRLVFFTINLYVNDNNLYKNVSSCLYLLNFRDYINDQKINNCIKFHNDLQEGAKALISFKYLAMREDYTKLDFEYY